jgi:hypothetical protein
MEQPEKKTLKEFSITEIEQAIAAAIASLINDEVKARIAVFKSDDRNGISTLTGRYNFDLELSLHIGSENFDLFDKSETPPDDLT